ncbi:MAG: hypothetical protein JST04_13480 [Bdellovibrionales bacterium]|nr:hypothetical protein [Bdellovibrionales bacterium]
MFEKKSVIASAILAGLVSGIALADEAAPAAPAEGAKMEKKNECKGKKNECKGHHKKHGKKKGAKDACSGPNGCDGKDMKKGAEKPAEGAAEAPKAE